MTNGNNFEGLPPIKRCRDYHLYDYKGNRYLDLYLDGGRALIGHKPGKTMLPVKNSLEKGIWAAYPSVYEGRLKKLLGNLFPGYGHITLFANRERALAAAEQLGMAPVIEWIPLAEETGENLLLRPLLPGIDQTHILLSHREARGDVISPVLLEGIIRSFHDLQSYRDKTDFSLWEEFDSFGDWTRKGPCLYYIGKGDYDMIRKGALKKGILLPGNREQPAFLPGQLSVHEKKLLKEVLSLNPGVPS